MPSRRAALQPTEPATAVPKPNILFFLADDIGPVYKPWNADSTLDAPHIADLAQQGMTFTKAYSDCALCAPSRYAALTGNHAHRSTRTLGVWGMGEESAVRDGQQTLGIMLQAQGYSTYFAGKWHLGGGTRDPNDFKRLTGGPLDHGFNDSRILWLGLGKRPFVLFDSDRVSPSAEANDVTRSEMLTWENWPDYSPCLHDMPDVDEPSPDGWSPRHAWSDEDKWVSSVGPCLAAWGRRTIRHAPTPFFLYYASAAAHAPHRPPVRFLNQGSVRGASGMSNIADMMIEDDRALGSLVDALEERDLLANTIILFTSDNGQYAPGAPSYWPGEDGGNIACVYEDPTYCRGTLPCADAEACAAPHANRGATMFESTSGATFDFVNGLRGRKGMPYEGGLRVPLVVRWGSAGGYRVPNGAVSDELITHVDLARTLLELTGGKVPEGQAVDGIDQSALLLGQSVEGKRTSSWHHSPYDSPMFGSVFVARVQEWKWIMGCSSGSIENATAACLVAVELYDLKNDPYETTNLINSTRQDNEAAQPWDLALSMLG